MSKPVKIQKSKAEAMIKEIDGDDQSKLGVVKLGRFYYDITHSTEKEVLDFMKESSIRAMNKIGATRL